jgi:hypothetical protein
MVSGGHAWEGIDMSMNDATAMVHEFLMSLVEPAKALLYSQDPSGVMVAEGLSEIDMTEVHFDQAISGVTNELNMAPAISQTLSQVAAAPAAAAAAAPVAAPAAGGGGGGGGAAGGGAQPTMLERIVNEFVTIVHEGNEVITNNFVDNSTRFDVAVDGDVHGDLDIRLDNEVTNANAVGDGAVAAGGDARGVATGDGAIAAGRDIRDSQVNSGDGAVQVGGGSSGPINTGTNSGIMAGGSVDDTIIGDGNTQVGDVKDGNVAVGGSVTDVETRGGDAVVGDGNAVVQGEGNTTGFGSGAVTDFGKANIEGSQVAVAGGAIQDNDQETSTTIQDSFNDQSSSHVATTDVVTAVDHSINDSFNNDKSFNNDDSFNNEDSFNAHVVHEAEAAHAHADDGTDAD